ncbi:MAG TPA: hypothetical protein DCL44_10755 [Elusimicrobia bacterium]|nr:hypothetical protein [Elusimicrobiota bacterium]
MLRETPNIRQIPGEPPRRWFADEFFDLIVWFDTDGAVNGFQLCYDREFHPRALTWTKSAGYTHNAIDDGDTATGSHKSSPVLVPDGAFNAKNIYSQFEKASALLPEDICKITLEKIKEFPDADKL